MGDYCFGDNDTCIVLFIFFHSIIHAIIHTIIRTLSVFIYMRVCFRERDRGGGGRERERERERERARERERDSPEVFSAL